MDEVRGTKDGCHVDEIEDALKLTSNILFSPIRHLSPFAYSLLFVSAPLPTPLLHSISKLSTGHHLPLTLFRSSTSLVPLGPPQRPFSSRTMASFPTEADEPEFKSLINNFVEYLVS